MTSINEKVTFLSLNPSSESNFSNVITVKSVFNFEVPTALHDVNSAILDPRDTYADAAEWQIKAEDLASRFIKNFVQYTDNEEGKNLVAAGPQLG